MHSRGFGTGKLVTWKTLPLGQVASVEREVVDPRTLGSEIVDLYSIRAYDEDRIPVTVPAHRIHSDKFVVPPQSILVSRINPHIPRVWMPEVTAERLSLASTEFLVLRPSPLIDGAFLAYQLMNSRSNQQFRARVTGTSGSHQRVKPETALEVRVGVPSFDVQRRIAQAIEPFDDSDRAEVRFGRLIQKVLRDAFRAMLGPTLEPPSVGSNRRNGPSGRQSRQAGNRVRLAEVAEFARGVSYSSEDLAASDTALVSLACVDRRWGFKLEGLKSYAGRYAPEQRLLPGELAVSHTDLTQDALVLGRPVIVQSSPDYSTLVASLDMVAVRPRNESVTTEFLYGLLSTPEFAAHAYGYANGTTVLHLSPRCLEEFEFTLPGAEAIQTYTRFARPLHAWLVNEGQVRILKARMRSGLVERAFNSLSGSPDPRGSARA